MGVFGSFQAAYSRAYHHWTISHPGQVCSIFDVAGLVNEALCKAATPENIFSAFKVTDIYPFNKDIFSDLDFVPSKTTENLPPTDQIKFMDQNNPTVNEDATQESQETKQAIYDSVPDTSGD